MLFQVTMLRILNTNLQIYAEMDVWIEYRLFWNEPATQLKLSNIINIASWFIAPYEAQGGMSLSESRAGPFLSI